LKEDQGALEQLAQNSQGASDNDYSKKALILLWKKLKDNGTSVNDVRVASPNILDDLKSKFDSLCNDGAFDDEVIKDYNVSIGTKKVQLETKIHELIRFLNNDSGDYLSGYSYHIEGITEFQRGSTKEAFAIIKLYIDRFHNGNSDKAFKDFFLGLYDSAFGYGNSDG